VSSLSEPIVSGVVLAAGFGRRMEGDRPKLLLPLGEETVLSRTLRNALDSRLDEVVLVLGIHDREMLHALAQHLSHPGLRVVRNPEPERGRLSSIRTGLDHVRSEAHSALFLCGDHPLVGPALIDRLLDLHLAGGHPVSYPTFKGRKGHPTVWARETWASLTALEEETGTGDLAESFGDRAGLLPLEEGSSQLDLNTPEDYARLLEIAAGEGAS